MTTTPVMINADAVCMKVSNTILLDSVSLKIRGGETVAIVGPNGAGKSTLLRMLSRDLNCTSGTIKLKDRDLASYASQELAQHRAMLSQHVSVTFPFSVNEIVAMGAGDRAKSKIALIDDAIAELELDELRYRELPTLSGGEQQRAHFARVLVQLACGEVEYGPGVLLLDEPTSSLDLRFQINLLKIAKKRARGGTAVVAVLHDLNLAVLFADRIVVLRRGALVADGPPHMTITNDTISRVFDVETNVGNDETGPFVLPQRMRINSFREN